MEHKWEASALQFLPAGSTKSPVEEAHWELVTKCGKPLSLRLLYLVFYLRTIPAASATLVLVPGSN